MALILLALWGCAPEQGTSSTTDIEVQCTDMSFVRSAFNTSLTQLYAWDEPSQSLQRRCVLSTAPTLTTPEVPFVAGLAFADISRGQDLANIQLTAFGKTWISDVGGLSFDVLDDGVAAGTFEGEAYAWDLQTNEATTERANIRGTFDWCESSKPGCSTADNSQLTQAFTLDTPFMNPRDGLATTCRAAYDAEFKAIRVDLEIGVWDGQNLSQLWVDACSVGGALPPQGNLLTLRAGGIEGPGSTVTQTVRSTPSGLLPSLDQVYPMTMYPGLSAGLACDVYLYQGTITLPEGATCDMTFDADHVSVACDTAVQRSVASLPISMDATGPLTLEADCEWVDL